MEHAPAPKELTRRLQGVLAFSATVHALGLTVAAV